MSSSPFTSDMLALSNSRYKPDPESPTSDTNVLTATLLFSVVLVSVGTWLPLGYVTVVMNGPQFVIINWIRSTRCRHLEGAELYNVTGDWNNATKYHELHTWCHRVEKVNEAQMLTNNVQLASMWAISAAMLSVGGVTAVFFTNYIVYLFGLKRTILLAGVVYVVATIINTLAPYIYLYELFVTGRFLIGLAYAVFSVTVPTYVSEISPPKMRGAMGTLPATMWVVGMILATLLGLPFLLGTTRNWPVLIAIQTVPVLLLLIVFPFCPESPRRLCNAERMNEAVKALQWLRRSELVEKELLEIQTELANQLHQTSVSMLDVCTKRLCRSSLLLCLCQAIARQFCGYSVIANYSTSILVSVGLNRLDATLATLGLWCTSLLSSVLPYILVDRVGRKKLLMASYIGMALTLTLFIIFASLTSHGLTPTKYGSLACVFPYMIAYQVGFASVPWILPAELFGQEARVSAMSTVVVVNILGTLVTTWVFPILVSQIREYTFIVFVCVLAITGAFTMYKLPETKGRSIEDIQKMLHGH